MSCAEEWIALMVMHGCDLAGHDCGCGSVTGFRVHACYGEYTGLQYGVLTAFASEVSQKA